MEQIIFDDSNLDILVKENEDFYWEHLQKIVSLDVSKSYVKLLNLINHFLKPMIILELSFDYETAKMLLWQAKEKGVFFSEKEELLFISKIKEKSVRRQLLLDRGYDKVKKIYKITDPHLYYGCLRDLDGEIDTIKCRYFRRMFIDKSLNGLVGSELLDLCLDYMAFNVEYFGDKNNFYQEKSVKEKSNTYRLDLISNYFFDDYFENVYIDLNGLLRYISLNSDIKINDERLNFYQQFIILKDKSLDEQITFFNTYKNMDLVELFYDDIRLSKNKSYQSLVDRCTQFTKDSPLYNRELSNKYNCDIYYLDGEEFYAFARVNMKVTKQNVQPSEKEVRRLSESFSYIGKDNIMVFDNPNARLTLLYGGIDYNNIGHVSHCDSYTSNTRKNYSDWANEIHTPDSLLQSTKRYNEIFICNFENVHPIAILCYDTLTDWDLEFSKRNNLPIVVINTSKYFKKNCVEVDEIATYTR